jgi:hypothetical protein
MQSATLTQAFQTALGVLITNDCVADDVIAGHTGVERIHPALTLTDIEALRTLLKNDGWRVQAISRLATRRRKGRILDLLPASTRLLREEIREHWRTYLTADVACGARPSCDDAAAFATHLLARIENSLAIPYLRFERSCNAIAGQIESKAMDGEQFRDAPFERVRVSRLVCIESFDFPIDQAMKDFRIRGTLRTDWPTEPTHLVFHVFCVQPRMVIATRLPAALAEALRNSRSDGLEVRELTDAASSELRPGIQKMIAQLVAARVLESVGQAA